MFHLQFYDKNKHTCQVILLSLLALSVTASSGYTSAGWWNGKVEVEPEEFELLDSAVKKWARHPVSPISPMAGRMASFSGQEAVLQTRPRSENLEQWGNYAASRVGSRYGKRSIFGRII